MATRSQINRLGEKLRAGPIDAATLEELQRFRTVYAAPMAKAQALLKASLGLEATARLKTTNTTIEKLRRERSRLAAMQDIAGLRVVDDWTLDQQDSIVKRIAETFPGSKVKDRRKNPSHGYRAVHIVATVDGHPLEIQVRTLLQDSWAQSMEKLADIVGRGIRYGDPPVEGGEAALALIGLLVEVSETIAGYESVRTKLQEAQGLIADAEGELSTGTLSADDTKGVEVLRTTVLEIGEREAIASKELRKVFANVSTLLDDILSGGGDVH